MQRTTRIALVLTVLLILAVGLAVVLSNPLVKSMLGFALEDRVFATVHVGDTERHLIELLKANGIHYGKSNSGQGVTYSHSDGFVGECFYYVTDGRVTQMAKD